MVVAVAVTVVVMTIALPPRLHWRIVKGASRVRLRIRRGCHRLISKVCIGTRLFLLGMGRRRAPLSKHITVLLLLLLIVLVLL